MCRRMHRVTCIAMRLCDRLYASGNNPSGYSPGAGERGAEGRGGVPSGMWRGGCEVGLDDGGGLDG
jgi:hypothetical protein